MIVRLLLLAMSASVCISLQPAQRGTAGTLGIFTGSTDVGIPSTIGPGSATYDEAARTYTIRGGGENMWATADHFHYVWKKVSGDVTLAATIAFVDSTPETGTPDRHRKACLVIRQSLDADSVYADAALHGDGLTSLQWRDAKGAITREVQASITKPARLQIEKRGNTISISAAAAGAELSPTGGSATVELNGEFYVGLGVTAHNSGRLETVTFSKVELVTPESR